MEHADSVQTSSAAVVTDPVFITQPPGSPASLPPRVAKCEQAAGTLWERTEELISKEKTLKEADALIAAVKEPYDRAAHDRYQVHPRHQAFIAENKAHWKNVRVFDAETAPA